MANRNLATIKIVIALLVVAAFMLVATVVIAENWDDADGDGVPNDGTDLCPEEAGPASNDGCPLGEPRYWVTDEATVKVLGLRSNGEGSAKFDTICTDSLHGTGYVQIDRSRDYAHRQLLSALERGVSVTVSYEHDGGHQDCRSIGGVTSEAKHYAQ